MSTALVQIQPVTGLPSDTTPSATDILLLIVAGVAQQAQLGNILPALAIATESTKGLLSAADKVSLDTLVAQVASILAPQPVTIATSGTINIPFGTSFVILTGTTTVTSITGMTNNYPVFFYYPSGGGLTFLGQPVQAGDPPLQVLSTAS